MKKNRPTTSKFLNLLLFLCFSQSVFSQNVGINTLGSAPDNSALLDIDAIGMNPKKGLLVPRMTTVERNAIVAPANSLMIFNTTTQCYEGWNQPSTTWVPFGCIGCSVPTSVIATAAPTPICVGDTLFLTGSAIGASTWTWSGPGGFSSSLQNPIIPNITAAAAGIYTLVASSLGCSSIPVATASVAVSAAPTVSNAGLAINPACNVTTAILAGNTPISGTGAWTIVSGIATITTPTSPTSGVTGLAITGAATLRWTISNPPCAPSFSDVIITTISCCPTSYTVSAIPFAPVAGVGTNVPLGDDQTSAALPINFSFCFYGNTYTQFYISSNGFIGFSAGMSQGCCGGVATPNATNPNNLVALNWTDLYPPGGGSITYFTTGVAPNRRLVVKYTNIREYFNGPLTNGQIVLYETTNVIELHITSMSVTSHILMQGVENSTGTLGTGVPGRNTVTGPVTFTNEGWRFQ